MISKPPHQRGRLAFGCTARTALGGIGIDARFDPGQGRGYVNRHAVPPLRKKDTPAKLAKTNEPAMARRAAAREGRDLGDIEAPDAAAAKVAAVARFDLDEVQRNRIMVQEYR